MSKLLYTGKSSKKYTHNNIYIYSGWVYPMSISITIIDNKKQKINLNTDHFNYFHDNFRILNDKEIEQIERKNKLNKISKKCQ
jgi:hypothetical protein